MIISKHAQKRFKERYGITNLFKMRAYAIAVLNKGHEPEIGWNGVDLAREGFDYYIYKQLGRSVFIYQQKQDLVLITIYKI